MYSETNNRLVSGLNNLARKLKMDPSLEWIDQSKVGFNVLEERGGLVIYFDSIPFDRAGNAANNFHLLLNLLGVDDVSRNANNLSFRPPAFMALLNTHLARLIGDIENAETRDCDNGRYNIENVNLVGEVSELIINRRAQRSPATNSRTSIQASPTSRSRA